MAGFHAILRPADTAREPMEIAPMAIRRALLLLAFARFVAGDIAKWSKVVKAGNIKVD